MLLLKRILVPMDFSDEAKMALEWAIKLSREENGATIYLLNVFSQVPVDAADQFNIGGLIESEMDMAKERLEQIQEQIPPPVSSMALCTAGDLATEITSTCVKLDIDLVIMTTHGRQGLNRVLHPNVTEKVVRTVSCPVLVLHLNSKVEALKDSGI